MINIIAQLRKSRKIDQLEFANFLGISRQTVSSLENNHYHPTLRLAFKISRFFEVPIERLFLFDDEEDKSIVITRRKRRSKKSDSNSESEIATDSTDSNSSSVEINSKKRKVKKAN